MVEFRSRVLRDKDMNRNIARLQIEKILIIRLERYLIRLVEKLKTKKVLFKLFLKVRRKLLSIISKLKHCIIHLIESIVRI